MVAYQVENIGRRVNLNENVFPVNIVLQILLQYDITFYTHDGRNNTGNTLLRCDHFSWPIDVFIKLNAPFEILVSTLEALWYAQEHPFGGRNRRLLVKWLVHSVEQWHAASKRQGGYPFGGNENAVALSDLLRVVLSANDIGRETTQDQDWNERGRLIKEKVDEAAR